jgi:hypothetical protein
MAKKHGPPLGKNKKKTFIEVKCDSKTYRKNCKKGYQGGFNNAHHVVPCTSLSGSLMEYLEGKAPEYRLALAIFTVWNVNEEPNLVGLPEHRAYQIAFAAMDRRGIDAGKPIWYVKLKSVWSSVAWRSKLTPKYPIHIPTSWGHVDYNEKVQTSLDEVWTKLKVQHENHQPISAPDLGSEIQTISNVYREKLQAKTGQTIEDWKAKKYGQFRMA